MKIAIVGCGALGSFYGAKLCAIGQEVHFLLRSDYEAVRRQGVRIESVWGDFHVQPRCARDPAEIGPSDLVVIGLKTTANHEFARLLPRLLASHTAILTLQNGLGNVEALASLFGAERVMGGLCFVCLNRIAPGTIRHLAYGNVLLGEYQRLPERRTHQAVALFGQAGLPCALVDNLARAHWEKLVWNIPFNGLGVAGVAGYEAVIRGSLIEGLALGPCLTTDRLLRDSNWTGLVRELMGEVVTAARQLGFGLEESVIEDRIKQTREMGPYKASTLIDYERGQPLELNSLFMEPLRRAQIARVQTPRLAALCRLLAQLDPRQGEKG